MGELWWVVVLMVSVVSMGLLSGDFMIPLCNSSFFYSRKLKLILIFGEFV